MENKYYQNDELSTASLEYFDGDSLASSVWINKYALKENNKFLELTPNDTIKRITDEIYRMEKNFPNPLSREEIHDNLIDFKNFIFGGSILFGLGNNTNQISSLGNCFFIDNGADSYGGIFNIDETMAQLMKRRGGVGITIENLRPSGATVNNSAQSSTGSISLMDRFSSTTREVAQDGRRGALMISMNINHPDSPAFIVKKDDLTKVTGANISLKVTDSFMKAVENDQDYILHYPTTLKQLKIDEQLVYNKLYNINGTYIKRVKAKEVWKSLIHQAHKNAEPGVLFWDTIINESPADCYANDGMITKGTNPCGEVPLSPFDSCRLGSLNLSVMVLNPYTSAAKVDWELVEKTAKFAQRVMDDIVSLEEEKVLQILEKIKTDPEPDYIKRVEKETWENVLTVLRKGRRTGIGVLGLGDMLAKLGIQYGSKKSIKIINKLFKLIAISCYKETVQLAKERGAFPIWDYNKEANNPFLNRVISNNFSDEEYNNYIKYGRRNIALLSIAPTGSLAILGRTTSGIEPVFKIYYNRRKKVNPGESGVKVDFIDQNGDSWEEYNVIHYQFINWYSITNNISIKEAESVLKYLKPEELNKIVSESPWAGSESHNIDYNEKVRMQGIIQKWIDHSISVTHNLPENISEEKVNDIYFEAWKTGCKGCTIYREGSRTGVLISNDKKEKKEEDFNENHAPKRPRELEADYYVAKAAGRDFAVIIGKWTGTNKPYEVFAFENPPVSKNTHGKTIKIKKGQYKFVNGEFEIEDLQLAADRVQQKTLTLTASMLLRHGAPIEHVNNVIKKIDENVSSFSSVVRRYLSRYINEEKLGEKCPVCESELVREEGCVHCTNCDYSRC